MTLILNLLFGPMAQPSPIKTGGGGSQTIGVETKIVSNFKFGNTGMKNLVFGMIDVAMVDSLLSVVLEPLE